MIFPLLLVTKSEVVREWFEAAIKGSGFKVASVVRTLEYLSVLTCFSAVVLHGKWGMTIDLAHKIRRESGLPVVLIYPESDPPTNYFEGIITIPEREIRGWMVTWMSAYAGYNLPTQVA